MNEPARSYLTGDMRSLGFRRRWVKGPQRDWSGKSDFKRQSRPEKPHFIKVAGKAWNDWRSVFDPVQFRRLLRREFRGMNQPGYAALKDRTEWVRQYGLRRKLLNAARSTRIRQEVANQIARRKVLK